MQNQLLLLEDVEGLGRCGEIVTVRPGYARNYLVPQAKALVANKKALRMQEKLIIKRQEQAKADLAEAEALIARLSELSFAVEVKVDPEGHLYGSVTVFDILELLAKQGVVLEKKNIVLPHPIKQVGEHSIPLKLKEGVVSSFILSVNGDRPTARSVPNVDRDVVQEETE